MECPEKMRSYVEALEAERSKIQVFRRELPLCLDLVTQAIEACKHQLSETTTVTTSVEGMNGQISECSEQNSMKGPILEEFIPIKRVSSSDNDHTANHNHGEEDDGDEQQSHINGDDDKKKYNWLDSVQLWNPNPEPIIPHEDFLPRKGSVSEGRANSGSLQPCLSREKAVGKSSRSSGEAASPLPPAGAALTSTMGGCRAGKREEKQKPSTERKHRRCWSADLHRRFVHALQQLGGPHVATPKQIRELMKVDGLTNDEVKSHLQKYRLHTKSSPGQNSGNAQPPQFVVVGGILMPATQPQYAAATAAAHGIYAPVEAPLPAEAAQMQVLITPSSQQKCGAGSSYEEFEAHGSSNSTTTTSSGRTITDC